MQQLPTFHTLCPINHFVEELGVPPTVIKNKNPLLVLRIPKTFCYYIYHLLIYCYYIYQQIFISTLTTSESYWLCIYYWLRFTALKDAHTKRWHQRRGLGHSTLEWQQFTCAWSISKWIIRKFSKEVWIEPRFKLIMNYFLFTDWNRSPLCISLHIPSPLMFLRSWRITKHKIQALICLYFKLLTRSSISIPSYSLFTIP